MRKLFLLSAVICAASFIMAAITHEIFGPRNFGGGGGGGSAYHGPESIFNETVDRDSEWHIDNEFANIEVDSAAVKTLVVPTSENEMIRVCAQVPQGKSITVSADREGDSLCIAAHPKSVTFNITHTGGYDGLVGWLDDIFGDGNGIEVIIEIPERILNTFTLKQGSGTTIIRDINAANNYIDIGSGAVNFYGSGQYPQNRFNLDLGSGKACVTNMLAEQYKIDVGSGKFVVSGLKGYGEIDFGAGKGSVFYSEFGGNEKYYDHKVDMGSGNLDIYLPDGASTYINYDVGAGSINIDALGVKQKLPVYNDDIEELLLGSYSDSTGRLFVDLGSGKVNIFDTNEETLNDLIAEYAVEEPKIPPKSDSSTASGQMVHSSSYSDTVVSSSSVSKENSDADNGESTVTSSIVDAPNPPEASDVSDAPEDSDATNPPEIEQTA